MKKLLALSGAITVSLVLYLAVFSVVQRPLTLGDMVRQLDLKLAYARAVNSPKIVVLAGSNGRYSHRCESIAQILGRPCANASIASGIGLDFLLEQFDAVLRPGDLVYMPLEYEQYTANAAAMHGGAQNAVLVRSRGPAYVGSLDATRLLGVFGAYDLPFMIRGLSEMALARNGFRRRTGSDTLTPQGDEMGHTAEKGQAYKDFVLRAPPPATSVVPSPEVSSTLHAFLARQLNKRVMVLGGLPTVPADTVIADRDIERIRELYTSAGQHFATTQELSRYPRSCFYDTPYHLTEECQMLHSDAVADLLKPLLPAQER